MKQYLIIIKIIVLILLCGVSIYAFRLHDEKLRIESNQKALLSELKTIEMANGNYKTEVNVLQLTNKELKEYKKSIVDQLKLLEIKIGQLASISSNSTHTITEVNTIVKDSFILNQYNDTIKIKKIDYVSKWLSFNGYFINDSLHVRIESRDSLIQVVYDDRNWFRRVFKFWENPLLKQIVSSSNPNCKIEYTEYIKLTNKRGN
jgi:hypothetical protein